MQLPIITYMTRFSFIFLLLSMCSISVLGQDKKWTLQECIDYGVDKSLQMERQLLTNKRDKMNLRDAALDLLPEVSGYTGLGYNFGRSIDPVTNTYANTRSMANSYQIGASLNIFSGFSAINTLRYNKVSKNKGLEDSEKQANDIAVLVMQAFYDLAYAEGLITISREQLENARIQLKKMERQHELGIKPKSDLFDIQAQVAESEYNLIANQNQKATALVNLKQAMNYPDDEALEIDAGTLAGAIPENPQLNLNDIYQKAKDELPEVTSAQYALRAARLNWYATKGRLLPSLSMSGNINTGYYDNQSNSFSSQFRNNVGKSFSFSLNIPLFSGLYRHSNTSRAKYQMQDAELALKQTEQSAYKEIQLAVQDLQSAAQEYTMALKKQNFSELSYEANKKKYEQGLVTIIDLNTSDNNLLQARHDVLKARLTYGIKKRMVDFYKGIPLQVKIKN